VKPALDYCNRSRLGSTRRAADSSGALLQLHGPVLHQGYEFVVYFLVPAPDEDRDVRVLRGVVARPESQNYGGCLVTTGTSGSEVRGGGSAEEGMASEKHFSIEPEARSIFAVSSPPRHFLFSCLIVLACRGAAL